MISYSDGEYRLQPGDVVGQRYRIDRPLGKGGGGEVHAAVHLATGAHVALKVLHTDRDEAHQLLREARAATAVRHRNVVEIFDLFMDGETAVMVMELLQGESLAGYEKRLGKLEVRDAADIFRQVADGLAAAHALDIVHRDLKPENIFLASSPSDPRCVKILDFGIAKVLDPARLGILTQQESTTTGVMVGTPAYMSYEQFATEVKIDCRTDIWSFGVALWEALCGRRPLDYAGVIQLVSAFLTAKVPRARDVMPDLPKDIATLLDACLQKDRDTRLGDIRLASEVLAEHLSNPDARSSRRRLARWERPRTWRTAAALVALTFVGAGVGTGWHFLHRAGRTSPSMPVGQEQPSSPPPAPPPSTSALSLATVDPPLPAPTASRDHPPAPTSRPTNTTPSQPASREAGPPAAPVDSHKTQDLDNPFRYGLDAAGRYN